MSAAFLLLSGAITFGYALSSLFFLRFWRRTHDRLFAAFAIAFLLLAVNSLVVTMADVPIEDRAVFYLLRLAAFATIIWAVIQKSRRP